MTNPDDNMESEKIIDFIHHSPGISRESSIVTLEERISDEYPVHEDKKIVGDVLKSVPYILNMQSTHIWIDYVQDADVLYISYRKPQHADDSEMDDNIITHYSGENIVGITVMGAKKPL
ncbi:DUF2283 domain-containing protein [Methanospirillum sp.]|uniref:DUF2283 domain-containing protein n=1 Tax=Methanospirillum sp. TaxID=45200 RepID=UPI001BD4AC5A